VGRIYAQVRERPRYIVEAVLEEEGGESAEDTLTLELSQRSQATPR
jgi:hypothetical protein